VKWNQCRVSIFFRWTLSLPFLGKWHIWESFLRILLCSSWQFHAFIKRKKLFPSRFRFLSNDRSRMDVDIGVRWITARWPCQPDLMLSWRDWMMLVWPACERNRKWFCLEWTSRHKSMPQTQPYQFLESFYRKRNDIQKSVPFQSQFTFFNHLNLHQIFFLSTFRFARVSR
jgi:hypothetical protein